MPLKDIQKSDALYLTSEDRAFVSSIADSISREFGWPIAEAKGGDAAGCQQLPCWCAAPSFSGRGAPYLRQGAGGLHDVDGAPHEQGSHHGTLSRNQLNSDRASTESALQLT